MIDSQTLLRMMFNPRAFEQAAAQGYQSPFLRAADPQATPGQGAPPLPGATTSFGWPGLPQAPQASTPAAPPSPPDWRTTGVFPGGGYDANAIWASDPAARQNAEHILYDRAGEGREGQNTQDMAESMAAAGQNQQDTGSYGYTGEQQGRADTGLW